MAENAIFLLLFTHSFSQKYLIISRSYVIILTVQFCLRFEKRRKRLYAKVVDGYARL